MAKLGYLGIDQLGDYYKINRYPRKELLEKLYRKSASKMYVDLKKGGSKHIGYVIANKWVTIYEVHEWKGGCVNDYSC